jgi:hypothetical protein
MVSVHSGGTFASILREQTKAQDHSILEWIGTPEFAAASGTLVGAAAGAVVGANVGANLAAVGAIPGGVIGAGCGAMLGLIGGALLGVLQSNQ